MAESLQTGLKEKCLIETDVRARARKRGPRSLRMQLGSLLTEWEQDLREQDLRGYRGFPRCRQWSVVSL